MMLNKLMKEIELLAPAKDLECGIAAINCGADAVYMGAPKFGAREAAGNSLDDLSELIKHAHKYWAKVYVTVNTLLQDEELPQAVDLISSIYELGADGVIIQDTGLLECGLPPIPIIASTQMHNNTPEKAAFLEKTGVQRLILARELDIEQIKAIRKQSDVELEFFVHGALCVCYSGQCYLSYAAGGRSGNRGQCAQPCRKNYSLADADGNILVDNKHLLSLKDLNLSKHLKELIEAGVSSFKIEGRLKDKAYVSNVVTFYRQKLDAVLSELGLRKSSSGSSMAGFIPDVDKTFNRGYTDYFLHGRDSLVGSIDTPKMMGEVVGKVLSIGKRHISLDSDVQLHPGDGICFFDRRGELRGTVVNAVHGNTITPDKLSWIDCGTIIHRNHDHEFLTQLAKARVERRIPVEIKLSETPDGLVITASDEDGNASENRIVCEKVLAQKPEQALENIKKQLAKSGGTEFECVETKVELSEAYFLPISTLNELRRAVLEDLTAVREKNRPMRKGGIVKNDVPYPAKELTFTGNVLNKKAEEFYRRHGVESIEPAAESGLDLQGRTVMTTRYCIRHQLNACLKKEQASYKEPLYLVSAEGHRLQLKFNCTKCEMEIVW